MSMGAVWGDYDNDGFEDLFLYEWGRPELFHNDGGQRLHARDRDGRPARVGQRQHRRSGSTTTATAGSICSSPATRPRRVDLWKLDDTRIMPESFEYANNGGRKYLFHNLGDGTFEDVSEQRRARRRAAGRWPRSPPTCAAPAIPISSSPTTTASRSCSPTTAARFREVGREAGVGYAPKSGMNASVGDVFNQGRFAIYVTNISEEGILIQGNNLWVPTGGDAARAPKYENLARAMGVDLGGWSFGAQFGDLNNDGNLDLYLVNGYVSAASASSYWYDFSKIAGGHSAIISRREELAGDGGPQPVRLPAEEGLAQRRRRPVHRRRAGGRRHRSLRRPRGGAGRSRRTAACSTSSSPTSAGRCCSTRTTVAPGRALDRLRLEGCRRRAAQCSNRSAIGARVDAASGTASSRCRRSPAAAASARRTSGACTSGWAAARRSRRPSSAGRRARRRN